jgi:hypothetical protein
MESSKRNSALIVASILTMLFLQAAGNAEHQAPATKTGKMVPDNPSEHLAPAQPIPYSHKKHLAVGLACAFCHVNPLPGKLMTFPETASCMKCHSTVAKDKPSIKKLTEFAKSKQPIPWVRVYTVLPGVEWNHKPHLDVGVKCEICHGAVADFDAMAEVTSVTTMYSCLNCHEMNHAKSACDTCHKH